MICTCICEFEIYKGERYWIAIPLGMEGATQGLTREDAIESAAEWLREEVEFAAIYGRELPSPELGLPLQHDGERVVVSVSAGRETVEKVTAAEAARILGVSRPRITQMLKSAKLVGWQEGNSTYVTRDSVIARLENPLPIGGRPKKHAAPIAAAL